MDQTRSNYIQDRSSNFRHNVPEDMTLPAALSAHDYAHNEKCKQMNKLRDWHLEAKDVQTDTVSLRSNFSNSRNFTQATAVQEIDHHKGFLIWGVLLASIVGSAAYFLHF